MKDITSDIEQLLSENNTNKVCEIIQHSMLYVELNDVIPVLSWNELCNLISRPDGSYTILQV